MSAVDKKRQHWLDADDNEVYASELRTAAAIYISELETKLAAETQRADEAEANRTLAEFNAEGWRKRHEAMKKAANKAEVARREERDKRVLAEERQRVAEDELRDLTVEHLGGGPWCEGCGRVTNQVLSSEHPGLCNVCAELETLKARRCEGCRHGDVATGCEEPRVYCGVASLWWDTDESCSRWKAREKASS